MKCEKCGAEIQTVLVNRFEREGNDSYHEMPICEGDDASAVIIETNQNWTGYGLSGEEMTETICCPKCKEFPFKATQVDVYDVVRVVCFKEDVEKDVEHE